MARKKNERPQSPMEFTAAAEKLIRKVYEDTHFNFGVKDEPDTLDSEGNVIPGKKLYTENKEFIQKTKEQMLIYAEMVDFYVQAADSHYPRSLGLLEERRKMQDNAIAALRTLKRRYQINLDILRVKRSKYSDTVELIEHEIAVISGWRKSDNKREEKLKG